MKAKGKNKLSSIITLLMVVMITFTGCKKDSDTIPDDTGGNLPDISGYPIVSTNQTTYYGNITEIATPNPGDAYYGQDAQYSGNQLSYTDNGNGTITDNVTGLMWTQSSDLNGDGTIDA